MEDEGGEGDARDQDERGLQPDDGRVTEVHKPANREMHSVERIAEIPQVEEGGSNDRSPRNLLRPDGEPACRTAGAIRISLA